MKQGAVLSLFFFLAIITMEAQTETDLLQPIDVPIDSCTNILTPIAIDRGQGGIVYYPQHSNDLLKKGKSYEVHGVVSDTSGVLAGVAIYLSKGEPIITDHYGAFSITTKNEAEILDISYIGYQDIKVVVGSAYRDKTIYIELREASLSIGNIKMAKPVIYLYPETKTEVSVINHFKGKLSSTYPLYNNGWTVIAEPNGKLFNLADNRNYNSLFWDGDYTFPASHFNYKEGFYVKKANYIQFLQEKLAIIGLNETETNDFIVYWLPILNNNEESFIHFGVNDDLGNSSTLEVNPKPDTMIRLYMEFKKYDGKAKLPEQKLTSTKRQKFILVEWGGAEVDKSSVR